MSAELTNRLFRINENTTLSTTYIVWLVAYHVLILWSMKRYYIPKEKRQKAWQWCLNNLGEREGIRVRFVNGMTGSLVKDRIYKKRMPVCARAFCMPNSFAGLIWEATW